MASMIGRPTVELRLAIELDEEEARALEAMAGYGDDAFIKVFYPHLGEAYMKPHEKGLRRLLKSVRDHIPSWLSKADRARKAFTENAT